MTDDLTTTLLTLENELVAPETRHSSDRLEALLCDDFYEIGSTGTTYTKSEIIAALISETGEIKRHISETDCRQLAPDLFLLTYRSDAEIGGKIRSTRRSSLWIETGGHYLLRFHQGTMLTSSE